MSVPFAVESHKGGVGFDTQSGVMLRKEASRGGRRAAGLRSKTESLTFL